jgi:TPR repeat protein
MNQAYAALASAYENESVRSRLPKIAAEIDELSRHGATLLPNYHAAVEVFRQAAAHGDSAAFRRQLAGFRRTLERARRDFDRAASERDKLGRSLGSAGDRRGLTRLADHGQATVARLYALVDEMQRDYAELERGARS